MKDTALNAADKSLNIEAMTTCTREPYVAGKFYPGTKDGIVRLIDSIRDQNPYTGTSKLRIENLIGVVLPHAGHIYSGYQTVPFFEILNYNHIEFDSFVILHPLHQGGYHAYATDNCSEWVTPLGKLVVDRKFVDELDIHHSDHLLKFEHSAEVILPFIQYFGYGDKAIIPIGISSQTPDTAQEIANKINQASVRTGRKICIIASSDFSHFLSPDEGSKKDEKVLQHIVKFETEEVYHTIITNNISICGYGPIMTLMYFASRRYQDIQTNIIARGHSGQVNPSATVVDYISILFHSHSKIQK